MKIRSNNIAKLEKDNMPEAMRKLFVRDLMKVAEEYFETEEGAEVDITRSPDGFSVCVLFRARRIKKMWSPQ